LASISYLLLNDTNLASFSEYDNELQTVTNPCGFDFPTGNQSSLARQGRYYPVKMSTKHDSVNQLRVKEDAVPQALTIKWVRERIALSLYMKFPGFQEIGVCENKELIRQSILEPNVIVMEAFPVNTMPTNWGDVLTTELLGNLVAFLLSLE